MGYVLHPYPAQCLAQYLAQVVDIPLDHPSCSKQHAAIQYRSINVTNEYGDKTTAIKPFIIDLESTNGTKVNEETIPASRYYELKASDGKLTTILLP